MKNIIVYVQLHIIYGKRLGREEASKGMKQKRWREDWKREESPTVPNISHIDKSYSGHIL